MIFAASRCGIFTAGCVLPQRDINNLLSGKAFPGPLLANRSRTAWHPDDYIFTSDESKVAADSEEAIMARDYMADTGWRVKLEN